PRRSDRRIIRRLAGGAAAPGGGTVQGRLRPIPGETRLMYKLSAVTKDYPKGRATVHALRGVDLEIPDGEWLAIQGPTGHGKSTLRQSRGGRARPPAGSVFFGDRALAKLRETERTKMRAPSVGFIFQPFTLTPTLSAQENVETALVPLGVSDRSRRARAAEAL